MLSRLKNWALFRLEQAMIRGAGARFAIILVLVVLVAVVGGLLARALAPGFESAADAIWWAFLRLTDPGYLGDDEGVAKATISTAVTVLGYVLFMGALIAILVQWLGKTMDRLEQGLTPVALDAHFVHPGMDQPHADDPGGDLGLSGPRGAFSVSWSSTTLYPPTWRA